MAPWRKRKRQNIAKSLVHRYIRFRSSIYSQVILVIGILSFFLLVAYTIMFRMVNDGYIKTMIYQNGNNVGSIVEGALYHSMLENNKAELQNTLDIINTMSGIDDVSMYDSKNNLAYSSFVGDSENHINPNCKACHEDLKHMFPEKEKSYRIIRVNDECEMSQSNADFRHLMIRSPILNQPSCYQNTSCHAHSPDEEVLGSLIIKLPLDNLDRTMQKGTRLYILIAIFITLFVAFSLVIFTRRRIKDPLHNIVEASRAIATGDPGVRLENKPDQLEDIRTLTFAFNHMMDSLEKANKELQNWSKQLEYKVQKKTEELGEIQNELISIERRASLGKLSSSVAHELNNPLSGILVYTKLVNKKLRNLNGNPEKLEGIFEHLQLIEDETKRCGDIVKGLLDFSRQDQENFEPKSLHKILADTYQLMHHPITISNVSLIKNLQAKDERISCSPNQVKQIFIAILVNASEAVSDNGEIEIRSWNPDKNHISVEVKDNGVGINETDISRIFEPFYTTKEQGNGIGLGLAIVHGLVKSHHGDIKVKSSPGEGTRFIITFPLIKKNEE